MMLSNTLSVPNLISPAIILIFNHTYPATLTGDKSWLSLWYGFNVNVPLPI